MKGNIYRGHKNLAEMIKGHIPNWKEAIEHQKIDQWDNSYFDHELSALNDIENAVNHDLKENNE